MYFIPCHLQSAGTHGLFISRWCCSADASIQWSSKTSIVSSFLPENTPDMTRGGGTCCRSGFSSCGVVAYWRKIERTQYFLIPPYSLTQHAFFPKLVWTSWYLKGWKILPSQFSFGFYRSRNSRQHVKMAQNQVRKARDKKCTDTDHRWGSWGEALCLIFIAWFLNCTHKMQYHHMQYVAETASWVQRVDLLPKKWVIPSGLVLDWGYKVRVINIPLVHKKFTL